MPTDPLPLDQPAALVGGWCRADQPAHIGSGRLLYRAGQLRINRGKALVGRAARGVNIPGWLDAVAEQRPAKQPTSMVIDLRGWAEFAGTSPRPYDLLAENLESLRALLSLVSASECPL